MSALGGPITGDTKTSRELDEKIAASRTALESAASKVPNLAKPVFEVVSSGPPHNPLWDVTCTVIFQGRSVSHSLPALLLRSVPN